MPNDPIDLAGLPAPKVVEEIDYEALLATRRDNFLELVPVEKKDQFSQTIQLDSEPAAILLQENAYQELILRSRINNAARSVMLAYAQDSDLDNLAALYEVYRLEIIPEDLAAEPPIQAVYESDSDLRYRTQLAIEGTTVAGSRGSYEFHGLSAHPEVADIYVDSVIPGQVDIYVLSRIGDGTPSSNVLNTVESALSAEDVRPLCDFVNVQPVQIIKFRVVAEIYIKQGPAPSSVYDAAIKELKGYLARPRRIGSEVPLSGIYAALHREGVIRVELLEPAADIECSSIQAAYCTDINLSVAEGG